MFRNTIRIFRQIFYRSSSVNTDTYIAKLSLMYL